QVAGRAGRAELAGRVLVQTYEADAGAIRAAASYNREAFLTEELSKRQALGYPPFVRLANILIWGKNEEEVKEVAEGIFADIEKLIFDVAGQKWVCFGAVPCVLAKLRETYRYHIVLKAPVEDDIAAVLGPLFRRRKAHKTVNVAVDIDPDDLL
ncbi:MAG: primosomal protein N', partial [Coriobacteriaceae bacterium]|nr:primosomal protein N' [Coriobacteriaceae bacterium]